MQQRFAPPDFTPRTLNQLFESIAQAARQNVKGTSWLVSVEGTLGELRDKGYPAFYVLLHGDTDSVNLTLRKDVAERAGVRQGDYVRAVGVITTRLNQKTDQRLEFRIEVSAISAVDRPEDLGRRREQEDKYALIRNAQRVSFPQRERITVTLLHSRSDQVSADFEHGLGALPNVAVEKVPVAMDDPQAIARAITGADGHVLALIRGGGPEEQFRVFEEYVVMEALAHKTGTYRVLGLGHTAHQTLLDAVCDHVAKTPSFAGSHIRDEVRASSATARLQHENAKLSGVVMDLRDAHRHSQEAHEREIARIFEEARIAADRRVHAAASAVPRGRRGWPVAIGLLLLVLGLALGFAAGVVVIRWADEVRRVAPASSPSGPPVSPSPAPRKPSGKRSSLGPSRGVY